MLNMVYSVLDFKRTTKPPVKTNPVSARTTRASTSPAREKPTNGKLKWLLLAAPLLFLIGVGLNRMTKPKVTKMSIHPPIKSIADDLVLNNPPKEVKDVTILSDGIEFHSGMMEKLHFQENLKGKWKAIAFFKGKRLNKYQRVLEFKDLSVSGKSTNGQGREVVTNYQVKAEDGLLKLKLSNASVFNAPFGIKNSANLKEILCTSTSATLINFHFIGKDGKEFAVAKFEKT